MSGAQHYFGAYVHPNLIGVGCPPGWGSQDEFSEEEIDAIYVEAMEKLKPSRSKRIKYQLVNGVVTRIEY